MDWSVFNGAAKMIFGAGFGIAGGIAGKVIYDRRFAKRPDLRYVLGVPATFGTGDKETVYQTLEVSNAGTETTTDVRINFSLPQFDLVEHQVSYDGPYLLERTTDRAGIVITSLPPGDAITLSFVFSPSKSSIRTIRELFLSTKSKDCVGRPLDRTKAISGDLISAVLTLVGTVGFFSFMFYLLSQQASDRTTRLRNENLSVEEILKLKKESSELARLQVQVANPVSPGREVDIQCYIDNMSENPFDGTVTILLPTWVETSYFTQSINVGAKTRKILKRTIKVPKDAPLGKYRISVELSGDSFDKPVQIKTTEMIEVK